MRIKSSILLVALTVLTAVPVVGQTIFSNTSFFTDPPMPNDSLNRSQGRKGFTMEFFLSTGANPPVQISTAGAAITFSVAGLPKAVEPNTLTPAVGNAGFKVVDGITNDGIMNSIEIIFNGDFAAGDAIAITVNGLTSFAGGFPQDHVYNLSYTAGPDLLRSPLTVALVLDVSGSMSRNIVGGAGQRIGALHHAVEVFLNTANDHAMLGDKIGVAYFTTNATSMDLDPVGPPLLVNAHIDEAIANAITDVNTHGPDAATSIGRGLIKARDELFVESPPGNTKNILLFSDGENNTPTRTDVSSPPLTVGGAPFDATVIKICPFTLGNTTTPGNALMSNIATDRCAGGNSHVLDVPVGGESVDAQLMGFFEDTLAELVIGDKLETSRKVSGTIGPGTVKTERFQVNPKDVAMTIVLSWSSQMRTLPFQLRAPDGTFINLQNITTPGRQNSVTTLTLPVLQSRVRVPHAGEWQLIITSGPPGERFTTDYHLMVMLDNSEIASTFAAIGADVGTGEDIPIRVSLKERGAPIIGATVTAQLVGPNLGIGNILSQQSTPAGTPNPGGDIIPSAAQAKLQLLSENPATAGLFLSGGLPTVPLFDDGSAIHNDAVAGDGIYNAVFKDARQEGHYNFTFKVNGSATTNGVFERTRTRSVFVRPKAVAANTSLTLVSSTKEPDGVIVTLSATPRDRFNNFIGPDYIGHLNIRSSQGTVESPLVDKLDGSYEISYRIPSASSNPDITVEVMGTDVVTKSLDDLGGVSGGTGLQRWSISLHAGTAFPHGSFGSVFDPGFSFGADLEYRFTPLFSLEGYLGHDRFRSIFVNDSFHITHLSLQPKFTFGTGPVRPSFHFGLGAYFPEGGGTRFGGNVGASLQFWITPNVALEPSYNYRAVNFSGSTVKYSTLQGGIRFRF